MDRLTSTAKLLVALAAVAVAGFVLAMALSSSGPRQGGTTIITSTR